jgi:hypothetical protein
MKVLPLLLLTACATTAPAARGGGPRGLRADEHEAEARRHDEMASERTTSPRTFDAAPGVTPWFRTWDTGAEHERLAREHRSQAATLRAAFDAACGDRPVKVSPLLRFRTGSWPTATGVVVYLSSLAGTADELLGALRCHRAYMMLAEDPAMDDCPLDLPGLQLDARGDRDGITLVLGVRDAKLVPELQRRVAKEAEHHHQGDEE